MSSLSTNYNKFLWKALAVPRSYQRKDLVQRFSSEFFGTFILLFFGLAFHSSAVLQKSVQNPYFAGIAFGFGALVGLSLSLDRSGGHLNPAVSLAMSSIGKLSLSRLWYYLLAQYLGAFLAALMVFVMYQPAIDKHWDAVNSSKSYNRYTHYSTWPAETTTLFTGFIDQVIGTGLLTFSIQCVENSGLDRKFLPIAVAAFLTGIVMTNIYNVGAILNPARDFSPRLLIYFVYGPQVWEPLNGHYWWLVAIVAPHIGGVAGVWIYVLFVDVTILNTREDKSEDAVELKMSQKKAQIETQLAKSKSRLETTRADNREMWAGASSPSATPRSKSEFKSGLSQISVGSFDLRTSRMSDVSTG